MTEYCQCGRELEQYGQRVTSGKYLKLPLGNAVGRTDPGQVCADVAALAELLDPEPTP